MTEDIKIIKTRSPRYPTINLEEAIHMVDEARKISKKATDIALAGKGSVVSGYFRSKKATLRYFGLIEGKEENTNFTSLVDQIIFPKNNLESINAIKGAFLTPKIYKSIYDDMGKNTVISKELLGNKIVREFDIPIKDKNSFVKVFIRSGEYAGLIKTEGLNPNEFIFLENEEKKEIEDCSDLQSPIDNQPTKIQEAINFEPSIEILKQNSLSNEIELSTGIARIIFTKGLTENDFKKLHAFIDFLAV